MKIETTKLKKISSYAQEKKVTAQAVYKWATEGRIRTIDIDGVTFVVMDNIAESAERLK